MKCIIVGGVAGGATAAARMRRISEKYEIILLEKDNYISYANCGLPYYIGGIIDDREKLFLQTPESFGTRFNVDVRVQNEVLKINTNEKELIIKRKDGSEYIEKYDKLLLSPGASPLRPPLEGIDTDGVFILRNVNDTDKIKNYVSSRKVKNALVIGAGFIGLEMAENLHHMGANVSIVEMSNQVMAPLDYSMASFVHQHLNEKCVSLHLEQGAVSFKRNSNNEIEVKLTNGNILACDIVILSIGVRPENKLAVEAGIKIGDTGGIWVDEYLETSVKDIYAVGDAIEFPHPITGKPWLNYLANPANRQARVVADNIVLNNVIKYEGAIGTAIAKVFDMTVASTGLAAKKLKQLGIEYQSSVTHSNSHAGYYPGALPLSIKLVFDKKNGKVFGAQIVGYDGVDKRIDQLALLIKMGGTVYDLTRLEHAYAPPYSSAKDPIAIAGYVASNICSGDMPIATWREVLELKPENVTLLDVRSKDEFELGHIKDAINIPLDQLRFRLSEISRDKPIYIYCAIGLRGYLALNILKSNEYTNVKNLSGGYKTYLNSTTKFGVIEKNNGQNTKVIEKNSNNEMKTIKIDACGLQCPGPIIKVKKNIDEISEGDRIEVVATDAGFSRDVKSWCSSTGNSLISSITEGGKNIVIIEKGSPKACNIANTNVGKGKTFIVFSDDLDKALATFVLANGAVVTGEKVTMFFTFWGLNVIKKINKPKTEKDIFGKMFSMMLPSNSRKLKLSKMNMGGLGGKMMRHIMKKRGVDSLESLRQQAIDQGVEFIACQMSMDVMGVKKEELLDNATIGGVATYMERAEKSNVNLFI